MRKCGLSVPVAALLSAVFAATAAAQGTAPDSIFPSAEPSPSVATAANTLGQERTGRPVKPAGAANGASLAGNPLWVIAIGELSETHARPIFSPSRRPPAPAVPAALPAQPVKAASPVKPEPDHPLLSLLGTIVGESVEIGVFVDEASHDVIRIKAGEAHDGWTLSAISGRVAIFQKQGARAATLVLPASGAEANAPSVAAAPYMEPVVTPGNRQMNGVAPATAPIPAVIPAATKGGSQRPPREG
jgi:general secretion pathway protein N